MICHPQQMIKERGYFFRAIENLRFSNRLELVIAPIGTQLSIYFVEESRRPRRLWTAKRGTTIHFVHILYLASSMELRAGSFVLWKRKDEPILTIVSK